MIRTVSFVIRCTTSSKHFDRKGWRIRKKTRKLVQKFRTQCAGTFRVKCPVSGTKSGFSFIWQNLSKCIALVVVLIAAVWKFIIKNNGPPTVNPTLKAGTHQADNRPSANVGPTASDGRASLFGVFHSSALVRLTSAAVCPIQHVEPVGERENSDWMFSLANESVPENYSESDENVNEGGTDRRLFKCYVIFPNHSNTRMFS